MYVLRDAFLISIELREGRSDGCKMGRFGSGWCAAKFKALWNVCHSCLERALRPFKRGPTLALVRLHSEETSDRLDDVQNTPKESATMATCLLHGTLHVTIYEGRNMISDRLTGGAPAFFRRFVEGAEDVLSLGKGQSQYYATVDLNPARVGRTSVVKGQPKTPVWNESFRIYCCHSVPNVTVSIKDAAIFGTAVIGRAEVPAEQLLHGGPIEDWYPLYKDNSKVGNCEIRFKLEFFQASQDPHWDLGIGDPRYPGVPYCYFPQRKGCKVTLYQDSHMEDGFLPPIYLTGGGTREPTRCWEDIFEAVTNAKHFIYVTGWSVYTEITLVRDPQRQLPGSLNVTLGELLKKKAAEGVTVNMLVWDDRTAVEFVQPAGLMGTHCLQTGEYFEGTGVNCFLCSRNPDDSLSLVQGFEIGTMFTHHQKSVMLDAPLPGQDPDSEQRRVVSFIGGIDLCDGRYDNQRHSLFHTLNSLHAHDFHQPNFSDTASLEKGGPREPWHDIHCRLEGPVAWDVVYNFEQRWKMQATHALQSKLLSLPDISTISPPTEVTFQDDPETWHVQYFRSIDAGAAYGFPEEPAVAERAGLVAGKGNVIDRSIQDAYINAIRRAKDFVYIENQYFLGSSFNWKQDQDTGADHLIPAELTRKITSKIADGERFCAYVVTPMWPEGIPNSGTVQAILKWQMNTMEMMYSEIAEALRINQVEDTTPQDYLVFFCLVNRETKWPSDYVPPQHPEDGSWYMKAQVARRFMIYVHAKQMIVDDEYVILGSANLNQRSQEGDRDTEMAMGAYQPFHLAAKNPARGQVYGFRMALWFEHLGMLDDAFLQPSSVDCIRMVKSIADKHWAMWAGDEVVDLPGHLATFPVAIGEDGSLSNLPGFECFPDTDAKILGTKSDTLPSILTD